MPPISGRLIAKTYVVAGAASFSRACNPTRRRAVQWRRNPGRLPARGANPPHAARDSRLPQCRMARNQRVTRRVCPACRQGSKAACVRVSRFQAPMSPLRRRRGLRCRAPRLHPTRAPPSPPPRLQIPTSQASQTPSLPRYRKSIPEGPKLHKSPSTPSRRSRQVVGSRVGGQARPPAVTSANIASFDPGSLCNTRGGRGERLHAASSVRLQALRPVASRYPLNWYEDVAGC